MHSQSLSMQEVHEEVSRLVGQGLLRHDDVDERAREHLCAQPAWLSRQALRDFSSKDMGRIKNKGNFLKGIVRKLHEGEGGAGPPTGGQLHQAGGYAAGGGYYPPRGGQHHHPAHGRGPGPGHGGQGYSDQYYSGGSRGGGGGKGGQQY